MVDPDFAAVLYAQDDMDIPAAAFDYLPYSCFYVESPGLDVYLTGIHGFFFYLGWDTKEQKVLLSFVFLGESGGCYPFDLPLDGESLDVCFDAAVKKRAQSGNAHLATVARQEQKQRDAVISLLRCALQVVLYLCASNAEIVPDPEQKTVTKAHRSVSNPGAPPMRMPRPALAATSRGGRTCAVGTGTTSGQARSLNRIKESWY